jgi:hypothetical protein
MAKKRHHKKVGHHRRKKVSGTGSLEALAVRILGVGTGAIAGAFVIQAGNTALATQAPPAWMIPAGVAVAGATLPFIAPKSEFAMDFGMGMLAVGGLFVINEGGFSIPGISGLAMNSNASQYTNVMRRAVGCTPAQGKMNGGPSAYLNKTVGMMSPKKRMLGALVSD